MMLEKYQKDFEWHFNEEASHNTGKPEKAAEVHDSLLVFLAKHLK